MKPSEPPRQVIRIRLFGSLEKARKITGFRALYFHYCYLLGIFPKNNPKQNRRLHFLLREDLRKLDEITAETRLLVGHRIDTAEQLFSYQSEVKDKITALTAERKQFYKLQRTAAVKADPEKAAEIKDQISVLSKELAALRKEVSLCDDIAERSGVIKEKIKAVRKDGQIKGKEKSADGMVDIMVRAEGASKINRIVERFKLAAVDTVSIKRDIEKSKAEKTAVPSASEQEKPDKEADDRLLDDLMGAPVKKEERAPQNPEVSKNDSFGKAAEKSHPSAPISKKQSRTAEGTVKSPEERPSVREELREIKAKQQEAAAPVKEEPTVSKKPTKQQTTAHKQPSRKKKPKSKER